MNNLESPRNDWAKVLWVLNATIYEGCSMATVLRDFEPFFYKFQTRLLEIEKEHPKLMLARETRTHTSNITGKTKSYTHYRVVCPKPYLINLYNLLNREGFKGKTHKPEEILEEVPRETTYKPTETSAADFANSIIQQSLF